MKAIRLCLIIVISAVVINFLRSGRLFHIAKTLPFSNAPEKVGIYDLAGVVMLIICIWGFYRLKRNRRQ